MNTDIELEELTMRNWLSYGNNTTKITLNRGFSTTLIKGEVIDESSVNGGSNGSGKTAILNAITYALYDNTISDMSKDDMVNDVNDKNMEVTITFSVGDGFKYRVERRRKMKTGAGGNSATLFQINKSGEEVDITPHSVQKLNEKVESLLGIPFELFVRIIVFSATNIPFLQLSAPAQKGILEELFQQTILTKKADALKAVIKDSESTIKTLQLQIDHVTQEQARRLKLVESTELRVRTWNDNRTRDMADITSKLKTLSKIDVDQQLALHAQLDNINAQIVTINRDYKDAKFAVVEANKQITDIKQELVALKNSLCPYCKQEFLESKIKITEKEAVLVELTDVLKQATIDENNLLGQIEALVDQRTDIEGGITSELSNLKNHQKTVDQLQNKLLDLSESENPHLDTLKDLDNINAPVVDYTDINKANNLLEHQKFLLKLLTKKDSFVRKAILQKHLPMLNKRLQHYIKILGLPFVVEFTHEMTANITKFGKLRKFGNLSNGQRARVNIALSFAFRDVLQAIHKKINMCILDEILDFGLCPIGVVAAARLLKQVAKDDELTVYIISHRDELQDMFDSVLRVQFKEGFSNIVQ